MAESSGVFAQRLKARRLELGLSVSRAAKNADVDRATWSKWEKGTSEPYEVNYIKIERALQWPPRSVSSIKSGTVSEKQEPSIPPIPDGILIDPADWAVMTPQERADYVRIVTGVRRRRGQQGARGA